MCPVPPTITLPNQDKNHPTKHSVNVGLMLRWGRNSSRCIQDVNINCVPSAASTIKVWLVHDNYTQQYHNLETIKQYNIYHALCSNTFFLLLRNLVPNWGLLAGKAPSSSLMLVCLHFTPKPTAPRRPWPRPRCSGGRHSPQVNSPTPWSYVPKVEGELFPCFLHNYTSDTLVYTDKVKPKTVKCV